jgi:hypothetical protein
MTSYEKLFEFSREGDRFLDYCLWDYAPVAPVEGKFRSVNQLLHGFAHTGMGERGLALLEALRAALGVDRTVWGLKLAEGRMSWEFYFYDYRRRERYTSISRVLRALEPFAPCSLPVNEGIPYFMFSLDFDPDLIERRRGIDEINVYVGNPGSTVSSGICWLQTAAGMRLANTYYFFDAATEEESIRGKLASSVHLGGAPLDLDELHWSALSDCKTIVVANKKVNDGIYYSRIDVDQLLIFMERLGYPREIFSFTADNRDRLDHLLYDVGIDYRVEDGRLRILKSGFYGVF